MILSLYSHADLAFVSDSALTLLTVAHPRDHETTEDSETARHGMRRTPLSRFRVVLDNFVHSLPLFVVECSFVYHVESLSSNGNKIAFDSD